MAVLIDPPAWSGHGRTWSHLISDTSLAELHAFAARLGVPERGFEGDHYDLPAEWYQRALDAGARPVSSRELLRALQVSGLRRRKRLGEKVIASVPAQSGGRVDAVLSALEPPGPALPAHQLLVEPRGVLTLVPQAAPGQVGAARLALPRAGSTRLGAGWNRLGFLAHHAADGSRSGVEPLVTADRPELIAELVARHSLARWSSLGEAIDGLPPALAALVARHHDRAGHSGS